MKITNILKGISGEPEIIRSLGTLSVLVYIIMVQIFVGYEVFYLQKSFDIVTYCTAFPGGLSVMIATVAGGAAVKDRNTAVAKSVQDQSAVATGELPADQKLP